MSRMMASMRLTVRALTDADAAAARQLGFEAFGVPSSPPVEPASVSQPGRAWFGAFDHAKLAARMVDRDYDSFFGGTAISTSGIAGVTVAAEYRGQGLLTALLAETLASARGRGAMISTLFPTAPGIYRRFGYEVVADFRTVEAPTQALAAAAVRSGGARLATRRAGAADFDAIRTVYDAWAREQNGPLTRRGVSFDATAEQFVEDFTGVTVAVDASDVVQGFASWRRGQGYGEDAVLEVSDLLATSAAAYRALLMAIGSFSSVTSRTRIDTSGDDLVRSFLPSAHWRVVDSTPYMLKLLDVEGAMSARRYPPGFSGRLGFSLTGDFLSDLDGSYVLEVGDGRGRCTRGGADDRTFTPQGLALLYAGTQSSANLRTADHLRGGDAAADLVWDALFGGRQQHIRDYF